MPDLCLELLLMTSSTETSVMSRRLGGGGQKDMTSNLNMVSLRHQSGIFSKQSDIHAKKNLGGRVST